MWLSQGPCILFSCESQSSVLRSKLKQVKRKKNLHDNFSPKKARDVMAVSQEHWRIVFWHLYRSFPLTENVRGERPCLKTTPGINNNLVITPLDLPVFIAKVYSRRLNHVMVVAEVGTKRKVAMWAEVGNKITCMAKNAVLRAMHTKCLDFWNGMFKTWQSIMVTNTLQVQWVWSWNFTYFHAIFTHLWGISFSPSLTSHSSLTYHLYGFP